jgi:hypothetical protein
LFKRVSSDILLMGTIRGGGGGRRRRDMGCDDLERGRLLVGDGVQSKY